MRNNGSEITFICNIPGETAGIFWYQDGNVLGPLPPNVTRDDIGRDEVHLIIKEINYQRHQGTYKCRGGGTSKVSAPSQLMVNCKFVK